MDRGLCLLLWGLFAVQNPSDAGPYSHADMAVNNYGNFGYPIRHGNNYGVVGGSYIGHSAGPIGAIPPPGYGSGSGLYPGGLSVGIGGPVRDPYSGLGGLQQVAVYPQQAPYGPGYQTYPGVGGGVGQLALGGGNELGQPQGPFLANDDDTPQLGIGSQFGGGPALVSNQPAIGLGSQFINGGPSNSFGQGQPGLVLGSQFNGRPSNSFLQGQTAGLGSQFAGSPSNNFMSSSPSFVGSQSIGNQQNFDNQQFGIVQDIQPNNANGAFAFQQQPASSFGSLSGFSSPATSSGLFSSGNGLSTLTAMNSGSSGLGTANLLSSGFSSPGGSVSSFGNSNGQNLLSSDTNANMFSSLLHSMGI